MVQLMDASPLYGKSAFVTGGSRGIGAYLAVALARAGANVAVAARAVESLRETCAQIVSLGRRAFAIEVEMTDVRSIQRAVETVEQSLGPIDILINNAGINIPRAATEVTEEQWDQILDVNLKGAFFCAQAVARGMIARQSGKIVNVSSASGLIPAHERAAYGSSKAGLIMLTRVLALEWAPHHITVNAVAPTFVETELAAQTLSRPGMREYWSTRVPLGRIATLADVAGAVLYLVSPAADFLTGTVIPVDGGLSMR
jgi:NAD(P)-dependent dehydrogenase (short-subunit alcohol dehydrogenase family)